MNKSIRTVLFFILFSISAYIMWAFYLKTIILNNKKRTIELKSLEKVKCLALSKWEGQTPGHTYGFELEINGYSNRTILLLLGPRKNGMMEHVLLKNGTIDFEYMRDWYSDSCYICFPSEPGSKIKLDVSYRFMGDAGSSF